MNKSYKKQTTRKDKVNEPDLGIWYSATEGANINYYLINQNEGLDDNSKSPNTTDELSKLQLVNLVYKFQSHRNLTELLKLSKISQNVLSADIFEITPKTFAKYKSQNVKTPSRIAELSIKLKELYLKGIELFGIADDFNKWMKESSVGLNGQVPFNLLNTVTGIELVEEELLRIEFGATA